MLKTNLKKPERINYLSKTTNENQGHSRRATEYVQKKRISISGNTKNFWKIYCVEIKF